MSPPTTFQTQQQPRNTLVDYWDDFYQHETDDIKEWIVCPNPWLFQQLLPWIIMSKAHSSPPDTTTTTNILEVGCGTSTLARDLSLYLQQQQEFATHLFSMTATDVSATCIAQNQQRDKHVSSIRYCVWNVVSQGPATVFDNDTFQVVLDKGCLDTLLFRSNKRVVKSLVKDFMNHIHQVLHAGGVYLVVTPRRKHALLNTFQGFHVERHVLVDDPAQQTGAEIYKADKNHTSFLYVCKRNDSYRVGVDPAFREMDNVHVKEYAACPSCRVLEADFVCQGRDRQREWIGHCTHCKEGESTTTMH